MKIQDGSGEKANRLQAKFNDAGDFITFTVNKKDLVELAKPSKTKVTKDDQGRETVSGGTSEGLMLSCTGQFNYEIDGVPVVIDIRQGQGGAGAWTSLKATKRTV